jgi:hypothetical protein
MTNMLKLLPPVLRARDFHLYLEGGGRLTDLWQSGGRAILGHKPSLVVKEMKNAAERGLFTPFPHPAEGRFISALSRLIPGRVFRLYNSEDSLGRAIWAAGFPLAQMAEFPSAGAKPAVWRPFMREPPASPLLVPVLPWPLAPLVLAAETGLEPRLPPGDLIAPVLLAAAARAVYDLIAAAGRGKLGYRKVEKALAQTGCVWKQEGIYVRYREILTRDAWAELWKRFLEAGFLLPPNQEDPLILPGTMPPGEEAKLAGLLAVQYNAPSCISP